MANKTIYPFGISGEQPEGIWSERIAAMQAKIDMLAPLAFRQSPYTPIYSIESPVTTQNYDTGVKLFDTPKSFTILCVATFNNYGWTITEGIYGISTDAYFRVGAIQSADEYTSGEKTATGNRYASLIMNNTSGGVRCTSIGSRVNGNQTMRLAVTYDHTTRKIYGQVSDNKTHWYIVPGDLSSEDTLKLLVGGASGSISTLEIYDEVLDWMTIDNFIGI